MKRSSRFGIIVSGVALCVCLFAIVASWHNWPRPRLNAILITLGSTRADRLGCYGYPLAQTPALDSLAQKGAFFENAYASVPLTLPAMATIFTSLYPPEHGLHLDGKNRLGSDVPVLTEFLKTREYETGAFVSTFALNAKFGLDRGFDVYDDALPKEDRSERVLPNRRDGRSVVDAALEWLKGKQTRPFFCWIHLSDSSFPFQARPETFGETFAERRYDAGIAFADQQVLRLTEFLSRNKLSERTLVVVVGDHGEGLMEHGEQRHGMTLYNDTLRVPLIVSGPRFIRPGTCVAAPVSQVDVMPTILSTLGIGLIKTRHRGTPLNPACAGKEMRSRIFHIETQLPFSAKRGEPLVGLVTGTWKYIHTSVPALYNFVDDPRETTNLAKTEVATFNQLRDYFFKGRNNMVVREAPSVSLTIEEQQLFFAEESLDNEIKSPVDDTTQREKSN